MLNYFCKDRAGQYVKTIVDSIRCDVCDKLDGDRMRFSCGHSACADCVAVSEECPTCTPLKDLNCKRPQSDLPQKERAKRASELLYSFQDTFQVDVYQQQRLSERLKIEKELFPECIQAPYKYFNKRKSLNVSKGKENRLTTFFPGEEISSSRDITMNKSNNYVQEWLNKQASSPSTLSRSPLSDLKVNTLTNQRTRHSSALKTKENAVKMPVKQSSRKRSRLKTNLSTSNTQLNLENYLKPVEKGKNKEAWMSAKRLKRELSSTNDFSRLSKGVCDESGIVIDDDCFTIEDTQDQFVDKDRLALLAVADADCKNSNSAIILDNSQQRSPESCEVLASDEDKHKSLDKKVPFYKKSYLFETCDECLHNDIQNTEAIMTKDEDKFKDLSITVENKSFITTIQVVDCKNTNFGKKQSTAIQTDVLEPFLGFEKSTQTEETVALISKIKKYIESESSNCVSRDTAKDCQGTSCSDAVVDEKQDVDNLVDAEHLTEAEDQYKEYGYGVLSELMGAGLRSTRRKPRGVTPDSNNSSDKENCDPNKKKKHDAKKKKKKGNK